MIGKYYRLAFYGLIIGLLIIFRDVQNAYGWDELTNDSARRIPHATLAPDVPPMPVPTTEPSVVQVDFVSPDPIMITEDGCCPYPQWSSDSEWVLFVDSVGDEGPGLYGVPVGGGPATFLTSRIGSFSEDLSLVAYPEAGLVYIEQWATGDRWLVPSEGRRVYLSHENEWIAWEYGSTSIQNQDLKQRTIWIATLKGEGARELVTVHGGRFLGWIDHGEALLVSGRLSPLSPAGIWRVERDTGAAQLLFATDRARDVLISAEGEWLALTVAFQTDRTQNGIWALKTDGSLVRRIPAYGSYRWRSEGNLLIIPYDFSAERPYLWQIDVEQEQIWGLTDPKTLDLPIANNDWQPSPDGQKIVYYSTEDHNLWVLTLAQPPK
jgi:hypothetical protein